MCGGGGGGLVFKCTEETFNNLVKEEPRGKGSNIISEYVLLVPLLPKCHHSTVQRTSS